MEATTRARKRVRLDREQQGYRLDGEFVEGFEPRPSDELSAKQRLQLARWARLLTPDEVSEEARRLLAEDEAKGRSREWMEAMDNRDWLATGAMRTLWRQLSEGEQALVLHPESRGFSYPLGIKAMGELTGVDERTITRWAEQGHLVHYRDDTAPRDAYRFHSAGLIMALTRTHLNKQEKGVITKFLAGHESRLLATIAAEVELRTEAQARGVATEPLEVSDTMMSLAEALVDFAGTHGRVTADAEADEPAEASR